MLRLGAELDLDMVIVPGTEVEPITDDLALVVAAHGRDELRALRRALEAGVPYVGLVASRVRGAAVVAELRAEGMAEEHLAALETPAGIDIGARTPEEIALSIFARIVAVRRRRADGGGARGRTRGGARPATAIDPVCGMAVARPSEPPRRPRGPAPVLLLRGVPHRVRARAAPVPRRT